MPSLPCRQPLLTFVADTLKSPMSPRTQAVCGAHGDDFLEAIDDLRGESHGPNPFLRFWRLVRSPIRGSNPWVDYPLCMSLSLGLKVQSFREKMSGFDRNQAVITHLRNSLAMRRAPPRQRFISRKARTNIQQLPAPRSMSGRRYAQPQLRAIRPTFHHTDRM